MKKILFAMLLAILLISGCVRQQVEQTTSSEQAQSIGEVKEFTITAKQFSFTPNTITVKKGDTVKISITSMDVTHGFAINEFGINVQLSPGKTEVIEFVANKQGIFTFYCSVVCGPGHSGMRGQLIVR